MATETRDEATAVAVAKKPSFIAGNRLLGAFDSRNFAFLILGRVTSNMGRSMRVYARAWLVLELTGSPFLLGLVTSSLSWPMLFMPFLGGVLADRVDRRKLLLYTEFSLALLWVIASLLITLGFIQWWHLMITGVASGMIQSIGRPGHEAMVANVVEKDKMTSAVAINSAAETWPNAIGLLLATLTIGWLGVEGLFWITATLQFMTGVSLLMMHWKEQREIPAAKQSMRSNLLEGFRHIKGEPIILGLTLLGITATLFAGSYHVLMPFFARDILGVGAQGLGILMLCSTLGVSAGSAVVIASSHIGRRGLMLVLAAILDTLFMIGFSRSEIFPLSLVLVFGMSLFATIARTMLIMVMQLLAPDHLRGRIMSLRVTIMGLSWIGTLWVGGLAEFIGVANTIAIGATIYGLVAVGLLIKLPHLRRFR